MKLLTVLCIGGMFGLPLWNGDFRLGRSCNIYTDTPGERLVSDCTSAEAPLASTLIAPEDEAIFQQKLALAAAEKTLNARTLAVARSFLGTPYVSGSLDGYDTEHLVVNLRELDCWTYVENCVAIALTAGTPNGNFLTYQDQLRKLRYWGGTINGYGSRVHYFTGWVLQAEKNGYLRDVTHELGGVPFYKRVSYITDYPTYYPQLEDENTRRAVQAAQDRINVHSWYFIPKSAIRKMEHLLRDGDIIILTASRKNLDVEHQGFAVRESDGRIHFMHASSVGKKVRITGVTLTDYLSKNPQMSGIMVARCVGETN